MKIDPKALVTLVDAQSAAIGLPIPAAHRAGVILNMERIAQMAALVTSSPLAPDVEPAPVFSPRTSDER